MALACRVPSHVVQRAATLYSRIRPYAQLLSGGPQPPPCRVDDDAEAQRAAELAAALLELRSVATATASPCSSAQHPPHPPGADAVVGPRERLPLGAARGVWWLYAVRWRVDGVWAVGATFNLRLCREQARRQRGLLDLVCVRVPGGGPGGNCAEHPGGSGGNAPDVGWGAAVGAVAAHRMAVAGFKLIAPPAFQ